MMYHMFNGVFFYLLLNIYGIIPMIFSNCFNDLFHSYLFLIKIKYGLVVFFSIILCTQSHCGFIYTKNLYLDHFRLLRLLTLLCLYKFYSKVGFNVSLKGSLNYSTTMYFFVSRGLLKVLLRIFFFIQSHEHTNP